jgi:uncharacterized protein
VRAYPESFAPIPVNLLVLQPTPFCNISCSYCYLGSRDQKGLMPLAVVDATIRNIVDSGLLPSRLSVIWHAGEPLVAPPSFYEAAFDRIAEVTRGRAQVLHSIQTNGTLLTRAWCSLFKRWNVRVGVSVDGPAFLHDKHRRTRSGRPTHSSVLKGIRLLQAESVPFHCIAVVTGDSLPHADEVLQFFLDERIEDVGFNIDEEEGANLRSSIGSKPEDHERFLERMLELALRAKGRIRVREFAYAEKLIAEGLPRVRIGDREFPYNAQTLPFAILTVDCDGGFSTYSPEMLDQSHPTTGDLVLGNVREGLLTDALDTEKFALIAREIQDGVERCRNSCEYFWFCGGGAPTNKLAEAGAFNAAETNYCRSSIQRPLRLVLERLEKQISETRRI